MRVVFLVFVSVCSIYVSFGLICTEAFGDELNKPLITTTALPGNFIGWIV